MKSKVVNTGLLILFIITSINTATAGEYRSPKQVDGTISTSAQQAKVLFDSGVLFIDVRNPRLYAKKHIPGTLHLDLKTAFTEQALNAAAKKDQPIVIYCSGVKCSRSYRASEKAVSRGYSKVHYFRGGIVDWKNAGYPTQSSPNQGSPAEKQPARTLPPST